jgi:uncharacterized protein YihD (DUF1040 family)
MRDPKRIEKILGLLREVWYINPDLRLTQLIMNVLCMNQDPYYVEDKTLEKALIEYKSQYVKTEEKI